MDSWELLEYAAVTCNVIYVILAIKRKLWAWPWGIIASILSVGLFYHSSLFAESALFVFYIIAGFYGWWQWSTHRNQGDLIIREWSLMVHSLCILLAWLLTFVLGFILSNYTSAVQPYMDSFTTIFAILATWLTAKRILTNWIYWYVVNSLGIYLYASRDLELYAALAFFFSLMSVYGFISWLKVIKHTTIA